MSRDLKVALVSWTIAVLAVVAVMFSLDWRIGALASAVALSGVGGWKPMFRTLYYGYAGLPKE